MVVWINGAFGVGKTSVARRLVQLWDGAVLLDPERIGFVVSRLSIKGQRGDFQDLSAWRTWTVRAVTLAAKLRRRIVVPMTIVNAAYFEEIVGTLRQRTDLLHFTLMAPPQIIRDRLRARGSARRWGEQQLERCTSALADARFATHVETADLPVEEVARHVYASVGHGQTRRT